MRWLALLLVVWLPATAAAQPQAAHVTPDSMRTGDGVIALLGEWRYQVSDDPALAANDVDDSQWSTAKTLKQGEQAVHRLEPTWYRMTLHVAPELRGKQVTLLTWVIGAAEVYLNGEFVVRYGRIGTPTGHPIDGRPGRQGSRIDRPAAAREVPLLQPVTLGHEAEQVLAVRFAKRAPDPVDFGAGQIAGFNMAITAPHRAMPFVTDIIKSIAVSHTFFGAMAFGVAFIHLMLFIFYPKYLSNLFYALFTLSAALLAFMPLKLRLSSSMDELFTFMQVLHVVLVALSLTGIRFLYSVFYERMPRYFWAWVGIGLLLLLLFFNGPTVNLIFFSLASLAEMSRVLVIAVMRRKYGAWWVASGVSLFIVASAYQMIDVFWLPGEPPFDVFLSGMLGMLVVMSVFLARGFATINRSLEEQVQEVQALSARTLEQERFAKEQEMERIRLENENALKAKELDEAHKRQQVLEELEQTHTELQQTQSKLVQSEKMAALGNLVAGVAHEINTPVGAITSMHDTLVRAVDKLKRSVKEAVPEQYEEPAFNKPFKLIEDANNVIGSGSSRVTDIVRRLRSFARLDEADLKRADIHDGLEDTLMLVHHELKRDITVHKNYGKIPPIACFPGQLNQVFLNLIVNARQAMPGGGEITITTSSDGDRVRVSIADTGEGIPAQKLAKIFDPGFTTKGVGVGTGLGLSICYQIVEAHHGTIEVTSDLGTGSTFTVILPTNLDQILEN